MRVWCRSSFLLLALMMVSCVRPPATATIRIAYPTLGSLMNPEVGQVFERTNLLRKYELTGELSRFPYGPPMMEAMASDKVDVSLTSEALPIMLFSRGYRGRIVGSFGSAGRMALMVRQDSPVQKVADLRGKSIGTSFGTSVHRPAFQWVQEAGLDPRRDVQIKNVSGDQLSLLLEQGGIDAIISWDPFIEELVRQKKARIIKQDNFLEATVMSDSFMQRDREVGERFVAACMEAMYYVATHQEECRAWSASLSRVDPDILGSVLSFNQNYHARNPLDIEMTVTPLMAQHLQDVSDFLHQEKMIANPVQVEPFIDNDLVLRARARFKGYYDANSVQVVK